MINKNELAMSIYKKLDIATNGKFSQEINEDDFIETFKETLYDYALVPITSIIQK